MSDEEEDLIATADILFGLSGVLIRYTGYLRLTAYEKSLDFYIHEPFFWIKMTFMGIFERRAFSIPPAWTFACCPRRASLNDEDDRLLEFKFDRFWFW
jgi:uncharacterized membrane protein